MEIIVAEIYSREIELLNSSSLSKYSEFFWPVYSRIRTEYEDRKTANTDNFQALIMMGQGFHDFH